MDSRGASATTAPKVVLLNSGYKMPLIGLGTIGAPIPKPGTLCDILVEAMRLGYRHFDTAVIYGSEESVGQAVSEAIKLGVINRREDVFITTKLWCEHAAPHLALLGLKESLRRLGLEYVDLYLIHIPARIKEGTDPFNITKDRILPFDLKGTWEAMEECSRLGLAKSIGVSNFGPKKVSRLLEFCTIPPAVNQVEMHVAWRQEKLREYCREKGVHVSAWSPLGCNGQMSWGCSSVMESPILKHIATATSKTVAQVALKWVYQQGASVIVKSFNTGRMKENLHIFEWELNDEELEKINQIPPNRGFTGQLFVDEKNGPYNSLDDFWN